MDGFIRVFMVTMGFGCALLLIALVGTLAEFQVESKEILLLMKTPGFRKNLGAREMRSVRSLSLIQVKMGSSYIVDKHCGHTILSFFVFFHYA